MRLIHITDPHLSSLDHRGFKELRGKRRLGYLSWRRKRRHVHRADILERLVQAVRNEDANQILLTGDLVHIGLADEIEQAGRWLHSLGPPDQVRLVLGNHDVYAVDSMAAIQRHWVPYITTDPQLTMGNVGHGEIKLQIIGLCSSLPTPALMASGKLGHCQLQKFGRLNMDADVFHCVLVHHPPLPGITHWRKALRDADRFSEHLRHQRPQLVLHGHTHRNSRAWVTPGHSVVYGTASASSADRSAPASYRVFDITRQGTSWRLDMALKCFDLNAQRMSTLETETLLLTANTAGLDDGA